MSRTPQLPSVHCAGVIRSADDLTNLSGFWRRAIDRAVGGEDVPVAVALPPSAAGVALFAAATARPTWTVLLPPDPRSWTPALGVPEGLPVIIPSVSESNVTGSTARGEIGESPRALAERLRRPVLVLPERHSQVARDVDLQLLTGSGVVLFTSGSTGAPKPVFREFAALRAGVSARIDILGLGDHDGLIAGVALSHGQGVTRMLSAMLLGGPFGLLDPLDHRAALEMLARPGFAFWSATAHFADVLGRCTLSGPAIAPRMCLLSSPVSRRVFDRFGERFGVPLRQAYSSSETAIIAVDAAPAANVQPETVGRPLPGVQLVVGDTPDAPARDGEEGRVWVRSPWLMAGYGFPPRLERPGMVDGWWPTRDLARWCTDGRLALAGRLDDCVRTREGRLVNLGAVAEHVRSLDGVLDAAVVPLAADVGASFGAVIACATELELGTLRSDITTCVPAWAWPRAIVQVTTLPRLPSGKVDRCACIALIKNASSGVGR